MKRKLLVMMLCLTMSMFLGACKGEEYLEIQDQESEATEQNDIDEIEDEMSLENRKLIADALGIEEDSRNIRFILSALDTIEAGELQSATSGEENGEPTLDIVAQDGTEFIIYLTSSGKVDAVKNVKTGEWPIQSYR